MSSPHTTPRWHARWSCGATIFSKIDLKSGYIKFARKRVMNRKQMSKQILVYMNGWSSVWDYLKYIALLWDSCTMLFENALAFAFWSILGIFLCLANLLKIMSHILETSYKFLEMSAFMLTCKNTLLVLTSSFSWVSLSLPRVFMLMTLKLKKLKLGPNQPICNKCVAFLALQVFIIALWRILVPLLRLCMLWERRMRLLFGDHPKIPHSTSLRICLLVLPCLLTQLWQAFWDSLRC